VSGGGAPFTLNRLALVAAAASQADTGYVAAIRAKVAIEREAWHALFRSMKLRYADSRGNFVFFETGWPHVEVAAALAAKGLVIGRPFPPLNH
jgi:histidinol-phosphate aminotransferase